MAVTPEPGQRQLGPAHGERVVQGRLLLRRWDELGLLDLRHAERHDAEQPCSRPRGRTTRISPPTISSRPTMASPTTPNFLTPVRAPCRFPERHYGTFDQNGDVNQWNDTAYRRHGTWVRWWGLRRRSRQLDERVDHGEARIQHTLEAKLVSDCIPFPNPAAFGCWLPVQYPCFSIPYRVWQRRESGCDGQVLRAPNLVRPKQLLRKGRAAQQRTTPRCCNSNLCKSSSWKSAVCSQGAFIGMAHRPRGFPITGKVNRAVQQLLGSTEAPLISRERHAPLRSSAKSIRARSISATATLTNRSMFPAGRSRFRQTLPRRFTFHQIPPRRSIPPSAGAAQHSTSDTSARWT